MESTLYIHRASAFDFIMFLHQKIQGTDYQTVFDEVLDDWVEYAMASTISSESLLIFFEGLRDRAIANESLGNPFIVEILAKTSVQYFSIQDVFDRKIKDWEALKPFDNATNHLMIISKAECISPEVHAFLTNFKIPRKFKVAPNVILIHSILEPLLNI